MPNLVEFGKRVRRKRIELHMSQDDLARESGYTSRSSINKIESGLVDLPQSKIVAIATALGVSPAYLVGWESSGVYTNTSPQSVFPITPHERTVIQAYREQPAMQPAVDRILGVEEDLEIDLAEDMAEALTEGDQMAQALSMKKSIPSSK